MAEENKTTMDKSDVTLDQQETVPIADPIGAYIDSTFKKAGLLELGNPSRNVTLDQLVDMRRRDGHGRALMQLVLLPIRYALQNGEWVAPDVNVKDAAKEIEFANQMWTLPKSAGGMSQPAHKVIRQMLLSITDGFAAFEQVITTAKEGPLKGKYVLKKLSYCDPRTVKIIVDEMGSFEGFRQRTPALDGTYRDVHVKKDYSLVFTHQDEENPYYGVSMFEAAYPHYEIRKKLYYIAHLAAQFAAVPGRIGTVPRGATNRDVQEFKAALANFAFNTSMIHKSTFEVTPFNGNSSFDFLKLIDHHRTMMSKSILAGFFDSENRTVLIENATMDASADLFMLTLETIANDIAHVLSDYLMPKFIDWNFGTKVYPRFVPAKLTDSSKQSILDLFRSFAVSGVLNCTPEMVREMEKKISSDFALDIDYDEIEKRELEAAEQQAAQEAEAAAMEGQDVPDEEEGIVDATDRTAPDEAVSEDEMEMTPKPSSDMLYLNRKLEIDDLVEMAQNMFAGQQEVDLLGFGEEIDTF